MKVSIIAAISENRALGKDNRLLWNIPEDMKRFKEITTGHVVIMGRKTFQSIGKPLPNRTNIVITRDQNFTADGVIVVHSLPEALEKAKELEQNEVFIIGGGDIYTQAMKYADKIYLTVVSGQYPDADTFFPDYSSFHPTSEQFGSSGDHEYVFMELER